MYPYSSRGVRIGRPKYVWSADITYVRPRKGVICLVAVMGCFSRYLLA